MVSLGFITIILCVGVILIFKISQNAIARITSLCIVGLTVSAVAFSFIAIKNATAGKQGIIGYAQSLIQKNVSNECFSSEKYEQTSRDTLWVVLRMDDIQAGAWNELSEMAVNDAIEMGIPPLLGVIPKDIQKDKKTIRYLSKAKCNVEIALHGWDHQLQDGAKYTGKAEFEDLSYEESHARIKKGKDLLDDVFEREVTTFIPPRNIYSPGTTKALKELGFKDVSAEGKWLFDFDATTYSYDLNRLETPNTVIENCKTAWKKKNMCVIMTHPQDFTNLSGQLDEAVYQKYYIGLLDQLKSYSNIGFITPQAYDEIYADASL